MPSSKKTFLYLGALFFLLIVIGATVIFIRQRQGLTNVGAANVSLQLVTASTTVAAGAQFNVDVYINTNGLQITGADLKVKYDPAKLQAVSMTQGSFLTQTWVPPTIIPGLASIVIGSVPTVPTSGKTGTGILATVKFKALATGTTANVALSPDSGISALNQGVNVAGMLPSINLTLGGPPPSGGTTPGTPTALNPIGTLTCSSAAMRSVAFNWSVATNAATYYVRIDDLSNSWLGCPNANPGDVCAPGINGLTFTKLLSANKSYRWWVQGISTSGVAGVASQLTPFVIPPVCSTTPPPITPSPRPTGLKTPTPRPTATPSGTRSPTPRATATSRATMTPAPGKTPTPGPSGQKTPKPTVRPSGSGLRGDINKDGKVNMVDIGIIVDNYLKKPLPDARADLSGDGIANIVDVGIIIDNYKP